MNVLFLASTPYSHIIPLHPLITELISKGNKVYCMSDKKNEELIKSFGAIFVEYPFDFERDLCGIDYKEVMDDVNQLWEENKYEEGYLKYALSDIKGMYNTTEEDIENVKKIVIEKEISIIFRDAVEKIGFIISRQLNIPCIGYITHNLYSKKYFKHNSIEKTVVFLGARRHKSKLSNDFLKNYYDNFEKINKQIANDICHEELYPLHQFDPRNDFTIVFVFN